MTLKKFYDRDEEQAILREEMALARRLNTARLVVVTGRRRIGKTELILQSLGREAGRKQTEEAITFIYLFCARITAKTLIAEWLRTIASALALPFVPQFERLSQVVEYVLYLGKTRPITIAIDECQDLNFIEPSFWSEVQRIWDLNKKSSQTLLVMSGSVASAMRNIFQGYSEPLYGRVDRFVFVRPFPIQVLKAILSDYSSTSSNEELLALYTLTGGVVWFVEELMDRGAVDLEGMTQVVFQPGSKFIMDGEVLLANEFRQDATVSRTLLQAIASGKTKREELQAMIPDTNISGFLSRLENHYELIVENKPLLSPNYRRTRYKLTDRYLAFWFSFVAREASLLAQNNYEAMCRQFLTGYAEFSGRALEQSFLETLRASHLFSEIGPWWDRKGLNELDIVAINDSAIYFLEVKRSARKFNAAQMIGKTEAFFSANPQFRARETIVASLSLEDLGKTPEALLAEVRARNVF